MRVCQLFYRAIQIHSEQMQFIWKLEQLERFWNNDDMCVSLLVDGVRQTYRHYALYIYNSCIAQQHSASSWWSENASWLLILVGGNFSCVHSITSSYEYLSKLFVFFSSRSIWLFYWSFILFLVFQLVFEKSTQRPMRFNVWFYNIYKGTWLWRFYDCSHSLILCLIRLSTHYYFRKRRIRFYCHIYKFCWFGNMKRLFSDDLWKKWRRTINNMNS